MTTAWRSNYQICAYMRHIRALFDYLITTTSFSGCQLDRQRGAIACYWTPRLSNTPLSPVSTYILLFYISPLTFFCLTSAARILVPLNEWVSFFDSPILLYSTHLHLQLRVCLLPLLGQLDLTTIKYLDSSSLPVQVREHAWVPSVQLAVCEQHQVPSS